MAKNSQTININFDASMDIKQVASAVQSIGKEFDVLKSKMPQGLSKRFTSDLQKLEEELNNFASVSSGMKNLGDIGKADKSLEKIITLYRKLHQEVSDIGDIDVSSFLPDDIVKKIEGANQAVKNYEKQINSLGKEAEASKKKVNELIDLKKQHKKLASDRTKAETTKASLQPDKIEATAARDAAKVALDKARDKAKLKGSDVDLENQGYKDLIATYQQTQNALDEVNAKIKEQDNILKSTTAGLQKNENAQKSYSEVTEEFGTTVAKLKASLIDLGDAAKLTAFEDLKIELEKIAGIDVSGLKQDLSNIKDVTSGISDEASKKVAEAIQKIQQNATGAEPAIDSMQDKLHQTGQTAQELSRAAQEVERLKQQVLDFFSIGNAIQLFKRAVSSAFETVKELDTAMTETAVVTEFNVGDMWSQLPQYTKRANELGVSIKGAYEAATLYYQQGLKTNEVIGVSNETLKMARIANIEAADATNLMTAALRGFNMEVNETSARNVSDVYSNLAAITAADTEEIGIAMSKTASIAESANMEFNTTAALLSQIIETTREAPETAGTAMKTIIARFTEVKKLISEGDLIGADEEGEVIDVNKIDTALKTVGISLKGFLQGTEGIDDIFLKLASKWDTLDISTQRYIATMAAGSRQQSRFLAMMGDYDRTMELVGEANDSAGASQAQFEKTLKSMETKLTQLKNAWDEFVMGLANQDILKFGVDTLTGLLNVINSLLKTFSGGQPIMKTFLTALLAVGAFKLGNSILGVGKKGGFLSNLFGSNPTKDATTQGNKFGVNFVKGVNDKIKKAKNTNFKAVMANMFSGKDLNTSIFSGLEDAQKQGIQKALNNNLNNLAENNDKLKGKLTEISGNINSGDIDKATKTAKECGATLKLTTDQAQEFGIGINKSFQMAGAGAEVLGGAFLGLATLLDSLGASDEFVTTFTTLGTVLMGAGAIMTTVSSIFTAAGVEIGAAGFFAQAGWWWLILIIAVIAAVAAGFVLLSKAARKASLAGQMEDAQKATENAKDAADKAKQAYDNLLTAREEYNGLQETLASLTEGTNEWKEALIAANQKVLELLTTYPQLAQYLSRGEDGQLTFTNEGWDKTTELVDKSVKNTSSNAVLAQMRETQLQGKISERALIKKFQIATDQEVASGYALAKYGELKNANYLEKTGSDAGIFYDQELMDELRSLTESGTLSDETLAPLVEENRLFGETAEETTARLYELTSALTDYDAALVANQEMVKSQAEAALTAGMSTETLAYDYSKNIAEAFANQITSKDYANKEATRADEVYKNDGQADKDNNQKFKDLAAEYNVTNRMVGNDLKDLKTLYAAMASIDVEDIPEDLAKSKDELAKAIGQLDVSNDVRETVEDFRKRMEGMGKQQQKELAGLMSGDGSQFTISELGKVKNLQSYAEQMGYTVDEMGKALGYSEKQFSELESDDQKAILKKEGITQGADETDEDYQARIDEWVAQNGPISIAVQMDIDSERAKAELTAAFDKATAALSAKTGYDNDAVKGKIDDMSITTVQNLVKQTATMGQDSAKTYLDAFGAAISDSGVDSDAQKALENYLSSVDLSSMTDIMKAMDYMQNAGVDPAKIQDFWDSAVNGANTYISSLSEVLQLTATFQKKIANVNEIAGRLEGGTGTYEDVMALVEAGADISDFQLTPEGWKATGEDIKVAVEQLKQYNAENARRIAEEQEIKSKKAEEQALDNGTALGANTVYINGKASTITDYDAITDAATKNAIATDLEVVRQTKADGTQESDEEYWARASVAYQNYLNLLNNKEQIQIAANKMAAMTAASVYTADENAAIGGSDESVRYSMQAEATGAGLDSNEVTASSEALKELGIQSQQVRDRLALDIALASKAAEEITSNYEEWEVAINDGPANPKYASSLQALTKSTSQLLGVSEDVTANLLKEKKNRDLVAAAANGDIKAYQEIQKIAAKETIAQLDLGNFKENADEINSTIDSLVSEDIKMGATLDSTQFGSALYDLLEASGATVDDINTAFESIGWEPQVNYKEVPFSEAQKMDLETTQEVLVPDGVDGNGVPKYKKTTMKAAQSGGMDGSTMVRIPILGDGTVSSVKDSMLSASTFKGKAPGAPKSSKGGGGGGGGGGKKEKWENPYDELYNQTEKVNEALRQREKIERDYDRLLKDRTSTAKQILANSLKEIANLREEIALQKELQTGRLNQINKLASETFKDEEGNEKTFSSWGATQYASYNKNTGVITIDWAGIDKITDTEIGGAVEEYISKLEELSEQFEETQDTLEDMEDQIREIQERGKAEYVDFEQRIYDALVARDQKIIDNYQELSETMSNSNSDILDALQKSIDLERQIRDNTKTEEDIAEKEARLAYLRRDTSGANALEIKQLEEELVDARETYGDTLVDQEIQRLSTLNEEAVKQRERQIEIMQSQLDYATENGKYWEEVSTLLNDAFNADGSLNNNSALVNLLKETEGFQALNQFGGMQWIDELISAWLVAQEGLANWKVDVAKQSTNGVRTSNAGTLTYNSGTGLWQDTAGGTYSNLDYDPTTGQYTASGYTPKVKEVVVTTPTSTVTTGKLASVPAKLYTQLSKSEVKSLQEGLNNLLTDGKLSGFSKLAVDGIYGPATTSAIRKLQSAIGTTADGKWGKNTAGAFKNSALKAYKEGGLVDFTGPAWMDGTKTKPELMLKSTDTENFLQLKEILAEILKGTPVKSSNSSGDNYYDIIIQVDSLSNDYDVEQLADKVKGIINSDARYRNVNALNFLR